jgi:hypothetical protein
MAPMTGKHLVCRLAWLHWRLRGNQKPGVIGLIGSHDPLEAGAPELASEALEAGWAAVRQDCEIGCQSRNNLADSDVLG